MSTATAPARNENGAQTGLAIKSDPRAMQFKGIFESPKFQASLKATLPKHVDPQRLIRVTLSAFQTTPALLECSPESVLLSLMRAAAMGLEPDGGPLGQGYLVPFWNGKLRRKDCQFIPGFRGLIKLARNSGEIADVWAEVVYEADLQPPGKFAYELGLDQTLTHVRNDQAQDAGQLLYAYAVARFRDGERKFVVMNKREVEQIKKASASKTKDGETVGPWKDWPAEMWKKTAVRRLCKMLPLSVEIQGAIAHEDSPVETLAAMPSFDVSSLPQPMQEIAGPEDNPADEVEPTKEEYEQHEREQSNDEVQPSNEGPSLSEELDAAIAKLANLTMQGDVNQMQANVVQRLGLTGELAAKWGEACEERKLAIRASRQKGVVGA